jgi:hypothetical protein
VAVPFSRVLKVWSNINKKEGKMRIGIIGGSGYVGSEL